jgi:hypothetical protein
MITHQPVRMDCTPHGFDPVTIEYKGCCGYISPNKKEFRLDPRKPLECVTCEGCQRKIGAKQYESVFA